MAYTIKYEDDYKENRGPSMIDRDGRREREKTDLVNKLLKIAFGPGCLGNWAEVNNYVLIDSCNEIFKDLSLFGKRINICLPFCSTFIGRFRSLGDPHYIIIKPKYIENAKIYASLMSSKTGKEVIIQVSDKIQ